ncbi:ketopantoate reductase family protein [Sporomusa acidovorans]|uniref:2-dehydropantoate 2-reductase n=1 Tax=Sporomusa acidovorans (strain ATCC 49682 / DSM 3132 / Mol) TaxID=1123286 RepID=A0ABZ3IXY1_SPOA4|nr:2-dehydropantoate 2-reductase [Sporomusa acidovorans]OZC15829.1 2-dehydropantoate 2-reductase [Sporomusa acidovorans DSM 3132]SDF30038.1 ketopantoate reductase [Sporomusa acidovorans]
MKVTIVGTGAIGSIFGTVLTNSGQDVTFVEVKEEYIKAIKENGLHIDYGQGEKILHVKITDNIEEGGVPDLIIMAVKAYDNVQAAKDCLTVMGPNTLILTMQNGVGNIETISEIVGKKQVLAGTTTFGSTVVKPGYVKSAIGEIHIGEIDGGITERVKKMAEDLKNGGFTVETSSNVTSLIWTKLLVNVGINAIGALTLRRNGEIPEFAPAAAVQKMLVDEGAAVAKALGIKFDVADIHEYVKKVCYGTAQNKASMYQDIERGSITEIQAINGAIVREGKKIGIPTPANEVITNLIVTRQGR